MGTGLDDGLDAPGIEHPRRSVDGDRGAHRTPSSSDSGTSAGQLPDLPEGSDLGAGNRARDVSLSSRNANAGGFAGGNTAFRDVPQMDSAELAAGLDASLSSVESTPSTTPSTVSSSPRIRRSVFPPLCQVSCRALTPGRPSTWGSPTGSQVGTSRRLAAVPQGKGTVTAGSAILREGDSFLVTLDQRPGHPAGTAESVLHLRSVVRHMRIQIPSMMPLRRS